MLSYCLKYRKNTKSISPLISKTKNIIYFYIMILSKCAICGTKKQEAKGLLSNLSLKTPLSKIPILGDILF